MGIISRRRRTKLLLITISVFISLLIFLRLRPTTNPHHYEISTIKAMAYNDDAYPLDQFGFLDYELSGALCRSHGWYPFQIRNQKRKVYDLLMIDAELDWLSIRLNELHHEVDYFIILESAQTHTGQPKPLHVKQNWDLFRPFHPKIIYHQLNLPAPKTKTTTTKSEFEKFQRDASYNQVIPYLQDDQKPQYGDIIIVGDVDELPRPSTLKLMHNCNIPRRLTLRSRIYVVSFRWLRRGVEWAHPQATTFLGGSTIRPNELRMPSRTSSFAWWDYGDLWNAGWFCRGCFGRGSGEEDGGVQGRSNRTEVVEPLRMVRGGEDHSWVNVDHEDVPEFVKRNMEGFGYLFGRGGGGEGAG